MILKKSMALMLFVAGLFFCPARDAWPQSGSASPPAAEDLTAEISAGYHNYSAAGYKGKVGEYEVLESGADTSFLLEGRRGRNFFTINGEALDEDDQTYAMSLDLRRILRTDVSYRRFRHFLDHDPLASQDSAHDFNPGRNNGLTLEELKADNTIRIPGLPFLKFNANVRTYSKRGNRQALTVSKCTECHVSSRNKRVNAETEDISAGAEASLGPATFTYSLLRREFTEQAESPRNSYGYGASFFLAQGNAPYSREPDSRMNIHMLNLRTQLPLDSSLFVNYQHGARINSDTHKEVSFNAIAARLSKHISRFLTCDVFYNKHTMNAEADQGIERDTERGGVDITLHPMKQAGLACSYQWENIDRKNVGVQSTGRDMYRITYNHRLLKKLRLNAQYKKTEVDDPFVMKDSTFPGLVQTSLPEHEDETFASLTWTHRYNFTLTANLRYIAGRNSRYGVDEDQWNCVVSFWYVPLEKLTLSGSYTRADNQVESRGSLKTYHLNGAESLFRYDDIPYDSRSQSWYLSAAYRLTPALSLTGEVTYIDSIADFDKNINSRNAGELSDLSIGQLETSLGITYLYRKNLSVYAKYMYREYDDRNKNYFDGNFSVISAGVSWSVW